MFMLILLKGRVSLKDEIKPQNFIVILNFEKFVREQLCGNVIKIEKIGKGNILGHDHWEAIPWVLVYLFGMNLLIQ